MAENNSRSNPSSAPKNPGRQGSTRVNVPKGQEQNAHTEASSSSLLVQILRGLEENSEDEDNISAAVLCLQKWQSTQFNIREQLGNLLCQLRVETQEVSQLKQKHAIDRKQTEADAKSKHQVRLLAESEAKGAELEKVLKSKSAEIAQLQTELKRKGEDVEQLQELEQDQRLLIAKLKLEHDKIQHEKTRNFRALTNELRQEKLKLETATEALNSMHQQHKFSTEQATSAQTEIEALMKEVFQLRRTSEDAKRVLSEKAKELSKSEDEVAMLSKDLHASQVEVSELHDKLNHATTREREQSSRIIQLTNRVQILEKRLVENMQAHEEEIASAATALEKNVKLRNVLTRDLQTSKSKLDLKEQLYTQVKTEYEQQLSELNGRLDSTNNKGTRKERVSRNSPRSPKLEESREESLTPRSKATYIRQQIASCKIPSSLPELQ